jgi:hypothetical protein
MTMPTALPTETAYYADSRVTRNADGSFTVETRGSTFDVSYGDGDTLRWCILRGEASVVGYHTADAAIYALIGAPES